MRVLEMMNIQAETTQSAPPAAAPTDPATAATANKTVVKGALIHGLLQQSVEDAYTLLNFACRQRKTLDDASTKIIIACHAKLKTGVALTSQEEAAFWDAFTKVIDLVKPVTVDSIVYTTAKSDSRFDWIWGQLSRGERALRRHLYMAVITLVALLVLQVQWAMGTAIYNDAYQVHGQLLETETAYANAESLVKSVAKTSAEPQAQTEFDTAKRQLEMDQSWTKVSYLQLIWWNRHILSWLPITGLDITTTSTTDTDTQISLEPKGKERAEFNRAELTLKIISNYFLVALFALLGAVTQALRWLSRKIVDVSLTSNDVFRGITRIILGVISGVCMAWLYLISAQTTGGNATARAPLDIISFFGAFAPWAIAFISGYSVEIFFTALERLIVIVTDKIKGVMPLPDDTRAETNTAKPNSPPAMTQPPTQPVASPPTPPQPPTAPAQPQQGG